MRFHLLGVSHSRTHREYSADAFAQKARLLAKLLTNAGHHVIHYGVEGADVVCTEHVDVVDAATFARTHGGYDWRAGAFNDRTDTEAHRAFVVNAIREIRVRAQPRDFLLCTYGTNHKAIAEALPQLIVCESGIGYEGTFAPYRAFESYAWMSYIYGKANRMLNPSMYDAVIPNYFDVDDYPDIPLGREERRHFFMIGRPTVSKGWEIAIKAAQAAGVPLICAGQGKPDGMDAPGVQHVGVVSIEQRAEWMRYAKAVLVPSLYWEPFGTAAIDALLCGTPVITTDFGAFTETIPHGTVGFRCRTMEQFIWAARNIDQIDPWDCRRYALMNYSLGAVGKRYEEWFHMLSALHGDARGWYADDEKREQLAWLNRWPRAA